MPEIQDSHGNNVVLGDITGYDKVVLIPTETEVGVSYGVYTEVDGSSNEFYRHHVAKFIGKGVPEYDLRAYCEAISWVLDTNPNCEIEIRLTD